MAALHSLLALYGAFDQSVVEANNPAWTARVEHFLPGFPGLNQHGWFSEIKSLVNQLAPDLAEAAFPSVREALEELSEVADVVSGVRDPQTPFSENDPPVLTTTDIAQLLYIVAVGVTLAPEAPPTTTVDFSAFPEQVEPVLGLAAQPRSGFGGSRSGEQASALLNLISNEFTSHRAWPGLMTRALGEGWVSLEVGTAPIPLAGIQTAGSHPDKGSHAAAAVTQVDGHYCAVLTTDCWQVEPGLNVDAVKAIVDPRNWPRLNRFFCQMDPLGPDARRASQVLEHVSTDKESYQLKTALKNWRKNFDGGGIVNYELADKRVGTGDSGLVLVDSGYIHISDNKLADGTIKGVRIKTSKWVAIEGASVTATAMYMLSLGWAAAGNAMLFDHAVKPPGGAPLFDWKENPEPLSGATGAAAAAVPQQQTPPSRQVPVGATGALFKEAARMWADCLQATTNEATKMMDKLYKGELTIQDLVDYTSAVGGRLASEPLRYINEVSKRVPTMPSPPSNTPQGKTEGGSS